MSGLCGFTFKKSFESYQKNSHTKKFKINEIQNKYQKKEKKKKPNKNMAPTGFELGSYGIRGRAPFHSPS
jgi:hypothetical protein